MGSDNLLNYNIMTREEFKTRLSAMVADEQGALTLDLRAFRHPYIVNEDNEIFGINELDEAYDFVKDSEEWYVDIYVNTPDEFGGHADFTGEALTSWSEEDKATEEWCPYCNECIDLVGLKVQKCPACGRWLAPCSLCPLENCAKDCALERTVVLLNISELGDNDGVTTRVYIDAYRKGNEECLSVGYDNGNPDVLLTFWQDLDDDNFYAEPILGLDATDRSAILRRLPF